MPQFAYMEKKLLSTVLIFSLSEVLEEMIQKLKTKTCTGCQCDHPSQTNHECIMTSEQEHLDMLFEKVYESFHRLDVLKKFSENVKRLNLSSDVISQYFFMNVIMLDKLRSTVTKVNVNQLMEKKIKLKG